MLVLVILPLQRGAWLPLQEDATAWMMETPQPPARAKAAATAADDADAAAAWDAFKVSRAAGKRLRLRRSRGPLQRVHAFIAVPVEQL